MKSNTIVIILLVILNLLVLGAFGFWFYTEKVAKPSPSPGPTASPQAEATTVSTLQPTTAPTLMPTSTPQSKSDLEMLKEAFAEKYDKSIEEVTVNISQQANPYATGGVKFAGEMGGAMWLAYYDGVQWIIVHDGHGTIPCEAIEPYDFPVDMVPECWDEATSTLITR